jgi:coenzyme F420 hydrogenase subunit delta
MDCVPEFCTARVLILGVGNVLFGDDGFGPEVIAHLERNYAVPADVCLMDVGTGVRKILFTLAISSTRPQEIVIVDAVDRNGAQGQIAELSLEDIPLEKNDDFSMHQAPTSNLLRELRDSGTQVTVLACDVGCVPREIRAGLSPVVADMVPVMGQQIVERYMRLAKT